VCCCRYMGFSWANGIIPLNLNGRNEESSSEAIAAYEAVALLGRVIVQVFNEDSVDDKDWRARGTRMWTMGRLLCGSLHLTVISLFVTECCSFSATELRSTKLYWHVQPPGAAENRVYPDTYMPLVIGSLWSMLAQQSTCFGAAQYLSYGIQLMPLTPVAQERDSIPWIANMWPHFNNSCSADPSKLLLSCRS
jgi:hypothetical protein